jgi:hypothetical protein
VAIDQTTRTIDALPDAAGPAIENEIPTYRAISARAIFSVACGLLSVCTFAHPLFYAFAILAIGFGISAHRTIRHFPDMLTGQRLASAGIGLGLIFGLSAGTITTVQYYMRTKQASLFATKFAKVLESADKSQILWYSSHPELRKDKTGADLLKELDSKPKERQMMESSMGPQAKMNKLMDRIKSAEGPTTVRFVSIETVGDETGHGIEMQIIATALYEVEGPPSKKFPEGKQFVLAVLKARPKGREYEWWSETILFPYVPASFVPVEKPVGEGHGEGGHSH